MIYTEEEIQEYLKLIKENSEIIGGYGYTGPSGGGGLAVKKMNNSAEEDTEPNDEDLAEVFREAEREAEEDGAILFPLEDPVPCCGII